MDGFVDVNLCVGLCRFLIEGTIIIWSLIRVSH